MGEIHSVLQKGRWQHAGSEGGKYPVFDPFHSVAKLFTLVPVSVCAEAAAHLAVAACPTLSEMASGAKRHSGDSSFSQGEHD